jgi:non-heme chloroperoxidase
LPGCWRQQLQEDLEDQQKLDKLMPPPTPSTKDEPPFADAAAAIIKGQKKYTDIRAPILAIFASPHSTAGLPQMSDAQKAAFIALDQARTGAQIKAFEKLGSAKVVTLPNADHTVFISNEQEVEKDINAFLATLNPEGN